MRDVTFQSDKQLFRVDISTHTPLAGRDHVTPGLYMTDSFLLTRPLRDVTIILARYALIRIFLLTRPLRDVTPQPDTAEQPQPISTHTPLAGRDFDRR